MADMSALIRLAASASVSFGIVLAFTLMENFYPDIQAIMVFMGIILAAIASALISRHTSISALGSVIGYVLAIFVTFSSPYLFNLRLNIWNPLEVYRIESLLSRLLMALATSGLSSALCLGFLRVGLYGVPEKRELEKEEVAFEAKELEKVEVEVEKALKEAVKEEAEALEVIRCEGCGGEVPGDAIFCPQCGRKLKE